MIILYIVIHPTNLVCVPCANIVSSFFLINSTFKKAKVLPNLIVSALIITWSPILAAAKYLKKKNYVYVKSYYRHVNNSNTT